MQNYTGIPLLDLLLTLIGGVLVMAWFFAPLFILARLGKILKVLESIDRNTRKHRSYEDFTER